MPTSSFDKLFPQHCLVRNVAWNTTLPVEIEMATCTGQLATTFAVFF